MPATSSHKVQSVEEAVRLSKLLPEAGGRVEIGSSFRGKAWDGLVTAALDVFSDRSGDISKLPEGVSIKLEMTGEKVLLQYDDRKALLKIEIPVGGVPQSFEIPIEIPNTGNESQFKRDLGRELDALQKLN